MKIAVLVYGLDKIGGIKKHALYLSREYVALGHEVDLYCVEYNPDRCYPDLIRAFDVTAVRAVDQLKPDHNQRPYGLRMAYHLRSLWKDYQDQRKLTALIPAGYDIINPFAHLVSWTAATYKRIHSTPVVWMCEDFLPVASYRYEMPRTLRQRIERVAKSALVSPFAAYDRIAVRSIDKIATLSGQVKSQMIRHYGVDPEIVRAGVDAEKFVQGDGKKIRSRHSIQDSAFLLLTVCALLPRRRLEDVVQAVRLLVDAGEDVHFLVVGRVSPSPEYYRGLQNKVAACNLDNRVRFVGEIPEPDLTDYYHACDAFAWASDENQSWGLASMEAMAAGKPLIISKANGLAEILEDGKTALIVPPRSPMKIAAAVMQLRGDQLLAEAIARNGKRFVCESYTWRKNAESMLALFGEAIASRGLKRST